MIILKIKFLYQRCLKNYFSTKKYSKRQFTWFNNRYNAHLKIDSIKKSSLILETLSKIT